MLLTLTLDFIEYLMGIFGHQKFIVFFWPLALFIT